jgi:predicted RNA-binding Zn-ribbon protein involved in translation (DUF1610 family)
VKVLTLNVVSTDLPNGEAMVEVRNSETCELVGVKIARQNESFNCDDCGRAIPRQENCFGVDGNLYCTPCGDARFAA